MPISVTCPSCSVTFKTKDEYAGKRAKCPKCAEPLTIPPALGPTDTVKMPPGAFPARPVVASKPKPPDPVPVDDEADEAPKPKRRRDEDEDEDEPRAKKRGGDDEPPVSPKRKRGSSDEDDGPKGKRRRRDDDEPKKKSKLPLILGILGGLLLVCGGGCAGVWFGVMVPAAEKAKKELDAIASDMKNRAGDGGQAKPTLPTPIANLTPDQLAQQHQGFSLKYIQLRGRLVDAKPSSSFGGVVGPNGGGRTVAMYDILVEGGGKTVKVSASEDGWPAKSPPPVGSNVEFIGEVRGTPQQPELGFATLVAQSPGGTPPGTATPQTPDITTTAVDLIEEVGRNAKDWKTQYQGKVVQLTGDVSEVAGPGEFMLSAERNPRPGTPAGFSCYVAPDQVGKLSLKAKDRVTVLGTIDFQFDGRLLTIKNSRLVGTPTPGGTPGTPPGPPPGGVLTADALIKDAKKYDGKMVVVEDKVAAVVDDLDPPLLLLAGPNGVEVTCSPSDKGWGKQFKKGDSVTLRGQFRVRDGLDGMKSFDLQQCELVTGKPVGR